MQFVSSQSHGHIAPHHMEDVLDRYQPVIGLEVHAQLSTLSKAYCADPTEYGALPNTQVSPISLGHPGTLPKANERVVEFAVRLGLALNCTIRRDNQYARKNYFYADLPKGYQITQDKTPICTDGHIFIKDAEGKEKKIRIQRIHMEEDAGKSLHDQDPTDTLVDLNRAGVPLLEIVTEPDFRNSTEAYNYLGEIRKLVRYLGICDGNMEEGSLRCDANVSVMLKTSSTFGNRCEVKNMNSIRNVQRAIDFEVRRQVEILEAGGSISQDTRSFDAGTGTTFLLRSKEMANDYRYFPEPDLQPVLVEEEYVEAVRKTLPPLPHQLVKRYTEQYQLPEYDALLLTETREMAEYFEGVVAHTPHFKAAANWMMGPVKSWLNERALEISAFPIPPAQLSALIGATASGTVSHTLAAQQLLPALIEQPNADPMQLAQSRGWVQESNEDALLPIVEAVLAAWPDKVAEYKAGKKGLAGLFMGEVMKRSGGKADPKKTSALIARLLEK